MICPHCNASIKYKERNYQICSQCKIQFAFEPKTHPLQLTDKYFSKAVATLSKNGIFYFTPHQLQFALSRKKMKSDASIIVLIVLAVITSIITTIVFYPALIVVIPLWIILIIARKIYKKKNIALPQTITEFQRTVLDGWKGVYKNYPSKLITGNSITNHFDDDLKGTLICEDIETALCLAENHLPRTLKLAIISRPKEINELPKKLREMPIYVLHDASINGYEFLEKIKQQFSRQTRVVDIGLRPQAVMKTKLPQLRQPNSAYVNLKGLTNEEIKWLKEGYYVPLFVLRPEKLIKYVTNQIGQKPSSIPTGNAEAKAKSIGFMTWVEER